MPFVIPLTYFFLLPQPLAFTTAHLPEHGGDDFVADAPSEYMPLPSGEDATDGDIAEGSLYTTPMKASVALTAKDKLRLVRPLLWKYMLPLCKSLLTFHLICINLFTTVCVYTVSLLPIFLRRFLT